MTNLTFIPRSSYTAKLFVGTSLLASTFVMLPVHAADISTAQGNVQQLEQKAPEILVQETVDKIITNIQENRAVYKKDNDALYQMLDETLVPTLHIPRMAKIILGKKVASTSTEAQKAAFAEEFKTLLMKTYALAMLEFTGEQKVVYEDVKYKPSGDIAIVKGGFISADGQKIDIILHMSNRDDTQWRAYNMEAAGINVLSTYKSAFSSTLKKKGIDGLIADLRKKNS